LPLRETSKVDQIAAERIFARTVNHARVGLNGTVRQKVKEWGELLSPVDMTFSALDDIRVAVSGLTFEQTFASSRCAQPPAVEERSFAAVDNPPADLPRAGRAPQ
jgi:hypothetical protein